LLIGFPFVLSYQATFVDAISNGLFIVQHGGSTTIQDFTIGPYGIILSKQFAD